MKAHGIYQSTSSIRDTPVSSPKRRSSPSTTTPGPSSKKRKFDKADQFKETNTNVDDDEGLSIVKPESPKSEVNEEIIKLEYTNDVDINDKDIKVGEETAAVRNSAGSAATVALPFPKPPALDSADDALLNDFISFGAPVGFAERGDATFDVSDASGLMREKTLISTYAGSPQSGRGTRHA